jgi:hypothetical protein
MTKDGPPVFLPTMTKTTGHQIAFPQPVGGLSPGDQARLWTAAVQGTIRYGFTIELADLEKPKTGTFDGLTIRVDALLSLEMQCFILLHLFGHSVQWVAPSLAGVLTGIQSNANLESFLVALKAYEQQAAQLGLALLHEMGVTDLDQWLTDSAETDWRYVERYYREGVIPQWDDCVVVGQALFEPLAIPELQRRKVHVRFAF